MPNFTHLHLHTQYSILDGACQIKKLIDKAKENNMTAVAITDHGNLFGVKEFYDTAVKKGIKPIIGCETYVAKRSLRDKSKDEDRGNYHLILLAKNQTGYKNLIKLNSVAWLEGFYHKPRIDMDLLRKHHEGLIVSSACLGGEIPGLIMKNNIEAAKEKILEYKNLFGEDFYLEIMKHPSGNPEIDRNVYDNQLIVNKKIIELAKELDVKYIATNDVHFLNEDDWEAHDRLICINTGKEVADQNRLKYTTQEWFKTREEMEQLFPDNLEALDTTQEIADKVETYELNHSPIMPVFEIPEEFGTESIWKEKFTEEDLLEEFSEKFYKNIGDYSKAIRVKLESDYLRSLVYKGAEWRYGDTLDQKKRERIDFELDTIKKMGYPGYFLIVQDFLNAARNMNVSIGPGRGSAAGSVVAFCLRITDVDPLEYNLLFERFLNPERISMPDIDIDFDEDGRDKVLQWVQDKYGEGKVAQIITFGTMAAKSSIRDVARVEDLDLSRANQLAKLVPEKPGISLEDAFKEVKELREARDGDDELVARVLKFSEALEGSIRQPGTHACGVIIGRDELTNYIPLSRSEKSKLPVTQFHGGIVESVGLLKMDFLGLKTLSIIKDTIENIKLSKSIDVDIESISYKDEKTFDLFGNGETVGVFQFESAGMRKYLKELKPNRFEDIIAMNALYRPGPMAYIPSYIARKHGKEKVVYDIPELEKHLSGTYGITVYQEQVMLLSQDLANFSKGQADHLRKAMGKKDAEMMAKAKEQFISGTSQNNHDEQKIVKIWNDWEAFAKYAFNKSHSTCYAYVAFRMAYLKAHYPAEFMSAVLGRNLRDITKIGFLIDEAKRMKIAVLGPDINESYLNFTVNKKGEIRFGLAALKNVGEGAVLEIINERKKNGNFKNVYDFVERVNLRTVNKKTIEGLALAGSFDSFEQFNRRQFIDHDEKDLCFIDYLIKYGNKFQQEQFNVQPTLFGDEFKQSIQYPEPPGCLPFNDNEKSRIEKEFMGMFLTVHPLDEFKIEIDTFAKNSLSQLRDLTPLEDKQLTLACAVEEAKTRYTKTGKEYGELRLFDYTDSYTLRLFNKNFIDFRKYCFSGYKLFIKGTVQKGFKNGDLDFRVNKIDMLEDLSKKIKSVTIKISTEDLTEVYYNELNSVFKENKGKQQLKFLIYHPENNVNVTLYSRSETVSINQNLIDYFKQNEIVYRINQ